MFANNRDFGKMFKDKHKRVSVLFREQLKQLYSLFTFSRWTKMADVDIFG